MLANGNVVIHLLVRELRLRRGAKQKRGCMKRMNA
jgi:hypothetical protein